MEPNRRLKQRFQISLPMTFTSLQGIEGSGTVLDISSAGLSFRTGVTLKPGIKLRASVSWPALLNSQCALQLVLEGKVVRTEDSLAVMSIQRHEFRTSGRLTPEQAVELSRKFMQMRSLHYSA